MKVDKELLTKGYIISSGENYTTYEKPKKISWGWFIFWFFMCPLIGPIGYLIYVGVKGPKRITEFHRK